MLIEISGMWTTDNQILLPGVCVMPMFDIMLHVTAALSMFAHATVLATDDFTLAVFQKHWQLTPLVVA